MADMQPVVSLSKEYRLLRIDKQLNSKYLEGFQGPFTVLLDFDGIVRMTIKILVSLILIHFKVCVLAFQNALTFENILWWRLVTNR